MSLSNTTPQKKTERQVLGVQFFSFIQKNYRYYSNCRETTATGATAEKLQLLQLLQGNYSYYSYCRETATTTATAEKLQLLQLLQRNYSFYNYCRETAATTATAEELQLLQQLQRNYSYYICSFSLMWECSFQLIWNGIFTKRHNPRVQCSWVSQQYFMILGSLHIPNNALWRSPCNEIWVPNH